MKKRWGKGDPVNLSDLLKITPVANEIIQLSEELDVSACRCYADSIPDDNQETHLDEQAGDSADLARRRNGV